MCVKGASTADHLLWRNQPLTRIQSEGCCRACSVMAVARLAHTAMNCGCVIIGVSGKRWPACRVSTAAATPAIHRDGNLLISKEHLLKATIGPRLDDASN